MRGQNTGVRIQESGVMSQKSGVRSQESSVGIQGSVWIAAGYRLRLPELTPDS